MKGGGALVQNAEKERKKQTKANGLQVCPQSVWKINQNSANVRGIIRSRSKQSYANAVGCLVRCADRL